MAPDASAAKSAKDLAHESRWASCGSGDRVLWGECKGSGAKNYRTQIDLAGIAFKCSCPSRKFPCKHGLGLFLLFVRDETLFTEQAPPDWVAEWMKKRQQREEKKAERADKPVDKEAQEKRRQKRGRRVEEGIADLQRWIKDIIRHGIVAAPEKEKTFWRDMSRRMVDAQAGGLASQIRKLGETDFTKENWQTVFLDRLAQLYLVTEAFSNIEKLSPEMQAEVRSWVGFGQQIEELRAREGVRDEWQILGRKLEQEDNVAIVRYWLYGIRSQQFALVLQFHVRGRAPAISLAPGTAVDAELVFYEGVLPFRAAIRTQFGLKPLSPPPALPDWQAVVEAETAWNSVSPFLEEKPVIVDKIRPAKLGGRWALLDEKNRAMFLPDDFGQFWNLLGQSGGRPSRLFLLGKEHSYTPLGIWSGGKYQLLG